MLGGSPAGALLLPCLRSQGALQWHGGSDPVSAETCSCAVLHSYETGVNLHCGAKSRWLKNLTVFAQGLGRKPVELIHECTLAPGAVCSVACLEWKMRIG